MFNINKSFFLSFLLLLSFLSSGKATTSGAIILKQPSGARSFGMGEAFTGLCDDINALLFNPAGIQNVGRKEIGAMWLKGLAGVNFGFLGYVHPFHKIGTFGLGFMFLDAGRIIVNDEDEPEHNKELKLQQDILFILGYARNFGKLYSGINVKYVRSTLIEQYRADVYALDWGLFYRTGLFKSIMKFESEGIDSGISIQNIGGKITYDRVGDELPLTVRGGFSYKVKMGTDHQGIFSADLVKPNDSSLREHFGIEYLYKDMVAVRAGYRLGQDLGAISIGIGMVHKGLTFDYGLGFSEAMNNFHRISFNLRFGVEREAPEVYF